MSWLHEYDPRERPSASDLTPEQEREIDAFVFPTFSGTRTRRMVEVLSPSLLVRYDAALPPIADKPHAPYWPGDTRHNA